MNTNILNITHAPKTNAKRNSCEADRTFRLYGNLLIQIKMYTVRNEMHYENATLMETNRIELMPNSELLCIILSWN